MKEATQARLKNSALLVAQSWDHYVQKQDFERMLDLYSSPRKRLFAIKYGSSISAKALRLANNFRGYTTAKLSELYSKHISKNLTKEKISAAKKQIDAYLTATRYLQEVEKEGKEFTRNNQSATPENTPHMTNSFKSSRQR